ncbi:hypothetical protein GCM10009660_04640 [Catellatospora bangladeshensis]
MVVTRMRGSVSPRQNIVSNRLIRGSALQGCSAVGAVGMGPRFRRAHPPGPGGPRRADGEIVGLPRPPAHRPFAPGTFAAVRPEQRPAPVVPRTMGTVAGAVPGRRNGPAAQRSRGAAVVAAGAAARTGRRPAPDVVRRPVRRST